MPVAIRIPLAALRFRRQYRSADCHGSCDPRNDVGSLARCACARILCKMNTLPSDERHPRVASLALRAIHLLLAPTISNARGTGL